MQNATGLCYFLQQAAGGLSELRDFTAWHRTCICIKYILVWKIQYITGNRIALYRKSLIGSGQADILPIIDIHKNLIGRCGDWRNYYQRTNDTSIKKGGWRIASQDEKLQI